MLTQGTSVYTWNAANRLVWANVGGVVSTYEYDGLGQRTSQTVDGVTTEYVLDVAGGLPEVIVATTGGASTYYVQIQGQVLAQQESGAWAYILPDHLGSVRQLTNASGQVTLAQSYDPFGTLHSQHGTQNPELPFGYTGEQVDAGTGLVFLRARYYDPGVGRFLSPDNIIPDYRSPRSINRYTYVMGNPVNHTDPSGRCLDAVDGTCYRAEPDPRDLTDWLYREMIDNANDPTVRRLKAMNKLARYLAEEVACDVAQALAIADWGDVPVGLVIGDALVANKYPTIAATALHGAALYEYSQLVKDGAVFDFKDETGIKLGPGITLCAGACYNDIEYSVPGNIHFAYIGGAAGISGWEFQAGAGYAEITDPAHDPNSDQYVGPYEGKTGPGRTAWDPSTWNFGDEPMDHEAVTLGIKLWENYEDRMTPADFEKELAGYISRLSRHAPLTRPIAEDVLQVWTASGYTYPLGYFDNRGRSYHIDQEQR